MRAYSIFDDFPQSSIDMLTNNGIEVTLLPKGGERPNGDALKNILDEYDIIFISTAQKMPEEMFADITTPKIIGTASSGTDHIHIPENKKEFIKVANATHANRTTVTEHTFALILTLKKQLIEGRHTAFMGKSKKTMSAKPIDLLGSTIGVVGAGGIASTVLHYSKAFGMNRLCWTLNPEKHKDLNEDGVEFVDLDTLLKSSDVISVNIPLSEKTNNLISKEKVSLIKDSAVFVTTSRTEITDNEALFAKAKSCLSFGLGMDVDSEKVVGMWNEDMQNVIITPHIGGGTIESRIRLFNECCINTIHYTNK